MTHSTNQDFAPRLKQRLFGLSALGAGGTAGLLLSLVAAGSGQAASYAAGGATATGVNSVGIGPGSAASGSTSLAVGTTATASGYHSIAEGNAASALGNWDIAIGQGAQATSTEGSVAIGQGSSATNVFGLALGSGTTSTGVEATAVGYGSTASGDQSFAGGLGAMAGGHGAVALGEAAKASPAATVAIGSGATATNAGDVALGYSSVTATVVQTATITVNGSSYDVAGTTPSSTVSVGRPGYERTITNVAAGRVSATSTDAVNGSELNATNEAVATIASGGAGMFQVYQSGSVVAPVASGLNSSAGGDGAVASGVGSTAVGYHSSSTGTNSVALGANSSDGGQSNVVSLGSPGAERRLTNVAPGINGTDGVNVNQLIGAENEWAASLSQLDQKNQAQTALALAATGLRYDDKPGAISVAAAASGYESHAGLAAGLGYTSPGGRFRYNLSATFAEPTDHADVGVVGGISYTFNH